MKSFANLCVPSLLLALGAVACGTTEHTEDAPFEAKASSITDTNDETTPAEEQGEDEHTSPHTALDVVLGEGDNGTVVDVDGGAQIVLTLPGNPTTGYSWFATSGSSSDFLDPSVTFNGSAPGDIGAPGTQTLTWQTAGVAAGTHEVVLHYARPWEKDVAPLKTFLFTVQISE